VEYGETLLKQTIDDINEIEDMVDDYDTIQLALAASWKRKAVRMVKERFDETGTIDIGELMDRMNSHDDLRKHGEDLAELVQDFKENPGDLPDRIIDISSERDIFEEAASFLEQEFGATVEVVPEGVSDFSKAGRARPGRPAIILD
ncbi:MAG: hypothetical protein SVU32_05175, partial [Candidatus Nanohaloarchaea archaeon]|nr:hypothetical protein [Candidatus Nanohaloarchaea archaeon]